MAEFLAIADSERLVRSFVRLKDGEARRKVTDLVEWLATTGEDASRPLTKPYGRS